MLIIRVLNIYRIMLIIRVLKNVDYKSIEYRMLIIRVLNIEC